MNDENIDTIVINLFKEAVESEGCYLSEADIESLFIKVNGPDEIVGGCAIAVADILIKKFSVIYVEI